MRVYICISIVFIAAKSHAAHGGWGSAASRSARTAGAFPVNLFATAQLQLARSDLQLTVQKGRYEVFFCGFRHEKRSQKFSVRCPGYLKSNASQNP